MVRSTISKYAKEVMQFIPNKPFHAVNSRGQGFSLNILLSSEFIIFSGFYPSMVLLPSMDLVDRLATVHLDNTCIGFAWLIQRKRL